MKPKMKQENEAKKITSKTQKEKIENG